MELRPNAKDWTIKECIIEDPVMGLSLQFEVLNGKPCLRIFKMPDAEEVLEFGNRDMSFAKDGKNLVGAGTSMCGLNKPGWPDPL